MWETFFPLSFAFLVLWGSAAVSNLLSYRALNWCGSCLPKDRLRLGASWAKTLGRCCQAGSQRTTFKKSWVPVLPWFRLWDAAPAWQFGTISSTQTILWKRVCMWSVPPALSTLAYRAVLLSALSWLNLPWGKIRNMCRMMPRLVCAPKDAVIWDVSK